MKNSKTDKKLDKNKSKLSKSGKIFAIIFTTFIVAPIFALGITLAIFAIWASTVQVDASLLPTANAVPTFYDIHGNKLSYCEDAFLSADEITDNLKYAFIATEDKRFYEHKGYDIVRIGGAILHDIKAGKAVEGASTITQQLVKNTHLSHERTLKRKLKEIAIAAKIEKQYSKDEILSMYLSVIYFGNGIYGAKQAAKYYFAKDVDDLTISDCATLAAIVKNPSKYSPNKNKDASVARRNFVIDRMAKENFISLDTANFEKSRALAGVDDKSESSSDRLKDKDVKIYFDNVVQEACQALNITKYQLFNGGYKIYTNFDPDVQKVLINVKNEDNRSDENVNALAILIENSTGNVLGYASTLGFNPKRQIGSTIKPVLYSAAFDKNVLTLATPVVDERIDFGGYSPANFNDKYYGKTTVKEAIKKSMNSIAVKTCDYLGIDDYFAYAKNFGLTLQEEDKTYALSLGATANGVSPLELASTYTVFANDGYLNGYSFVSFIQKDDSKVYDASKIPIQVIRPSSAQLVTVALQSTVQDGTAKGLSSLNFDIAAKTGTVERESDGNSDAWCVSYTPEYTLLVWHGSDETMNEKGGGLPTKESANIWKSLSNISVNGTQIIDENAKFALDDIVEQEIDLYSAARSQKVVTASDNVPLEYRKVEYFAIENLPNLIGSYFEKVAEPNFTVAKLPYAVKIDFNADKIYDYDLYLTDIFGRRKVLHVEHETVDLATVKTNDDFVKQISFVDRPILLSRFAEYTLVASVPNSQIKNSSTIKLFVDELTSN